MEYAVPVAVKGVLAFLFVMKDRQRERERGGTAGGEREKRRIMRQLRETQKMTAKSVGNGWAEGGKEENGVKSGGGEGRGGGADAQRKGTERCSREEKNATRERTGKAKECAGTGGKRWESRENV